MDPTATAGGYAGRRIGHYRVMEKLGAGGMGEVYEGYDEKLDRPVAIKALPGRLATDELARERFLRETRMACKVTHSYVATVFDVVAEGDDVLLVMERIDGRPLSEVLRRERPSLDELTGWFVEIGEALTAIHGARLIHRDLKPGNVMLTADRHVKVMDFGVARSLRSGLLDAADSTAPTAEPTLTGQGRGVGTVAYMSPEQVRGERDIDGRSDLFSLGTMFYEAVTGEHPFRRGSMLDTAAAILNDQPGRGTEPESLTNSGPLRDVVMRLLQKDREKRYKSAAALVDDLRAVQQGGKISPVPRPPRRRGLTAAVAVGAVLAVSLIAWKAWDAWRRHPAVPDKRPVVAVLPFDDRTGEDTDPLRGEMLAELLAIDLGESRLVQALETARVIEIVGGAGGSERAARDRVVDAARVDWLLSTNLFSEGKVYVASFSAWQPGESEPSSSFTVRAGSTIAIVDLAKLKLRQALFPGVDAAEDPRTERLSSASAEARALEYRARRALRELRYKEAIDLLERAVSVAPQWAMAHARLAEVLQAAGYGSRARRSAETAERLGARPAAVASERQRVALAASIAAVKGSAREEADLRTALAERYPDEPALQTRAAMALMKLEKTDQALGFIDRAVAVDPTDPGALLGKTRVLTRRGEYAEALEAASEAEKIFESVNSDIGLVNVDFQRGSALHRQQNYEAAASYFQRAVERSRIASLGTFEARALKALGDCAVEEGNLAEARTLYEGAISVAEPLGDNVTLVTTLDGLGQQLYARGMLEDAERYLRQALAVGDPLQNPRLTIYPRVHLAGVLQLMGRRGEARGWAAEALTQAREFELQAVETTALLLLAEADSQSGQLADAVAACEDVIRLESGPEGSEKLRAYAWFTLGEIRHAAGATSRALSALDEAVRINREIGDRLQLGYSLCARARLHADLGAADRFAEDLDEARRLAGEGGDALQDLVARIGLARGMEALRRGEWQAAVDELERVRHAEGVSVASPARIGICEGRLRLGALEPALAACEAALADPSITAVEAMNARATAALAAGLSGRAAEAEREARRALDEASTLGAPLGVAKSAAVLAGLPGVRDATELRSRGSTAWREFVAAAPESRRDALRRREDLRPWIEMLEGPLLSTAGGE